MNMQDLFGPLESAIYETVNGFVDPMDTRKRGATALAPRIGMVPGTLSNKANPLQDSALTLRESVPVQLAASDFRILYAYNQVLGHAAYRLPVNDHVGDVALLDSYCDLHAEVGALANEIRKILKDGRVHAVELPPLRARFDALVRAGLGVVTRIEALAE